MSAFKVLVVVAVVLCVHALTVEGAKGGKRKQQTNPRQKGNQHGGRPHGNGNRPPPGNGGGRRNPNQGPPPKPRRAVKRPHPGSPPPPGRRAAKPVNARPRQKRPNPEKMHQLQCMRLMMIKNTNEQIEKCQKDTPKAAGQTIEDHKEDVYMCLQREHGVMNSKGEPVVESIIHHIDENEKINNQDLKDQLKAQVEVCAKAISSDNPKESSREFKDCIITFCKGEKAEEENEAAEEPAAEE